MRLTLLKALSVFLFLQQSSLRAFYRVIYVAEGRVSGNGHCVKRFAFGPQYGPQAQ